MTKSASLPEQTQNVENRMPATGKDEQSIIQRRVKTRQRKTGTATCGFINARPSHAPPAILLRSATLNAAMLHANATAVNCVSVLTPPQQRNISTGSTI